MRSFSVRSSLFAFSNFGRSPHSDSSKDSNSIYKMNSCNKIRRLTKYIHRITKVYSEINLLVKKIKKQQPYFYWICVFKLCSPHCTTTRAFIHDYPIRCSICIYCKYCIIFRLVTVLEGLVMVSLWLRVQVHMQSYPIPPGQSWQGQRKGPFWLRRFFVEYHLHLPPHLKEHLKDRKTNATSKCLLIYLHYGQENNFE